MTTPTITPQEVALLESVAKYAVSFTTAANPYNIQRETLNARSAAEARDILQACDARVIDVTPIIANTDAAWYAEMLAREADFQDLKVTQEDARY